MTKQIQFDYTAPVPCTDSEAEEFIMYQLGYSDINEGNPLYQYAFTSGKINNLNIDGNDITPVFQ